MATFDAVLQRFESCVKRLEQLEGAPAKMGSSMSSNAKPAGQPSETAESGPVSPRAAAYQAYFKEHVDPFLATCDAIGGDIQKIGNLSKKAFAFVGSMVQTASQCAKPEESDVREYIEPLSKLVQEAVAAQDNRSKCYFHQAGFAEALPALFWVIVPTTPQGHVQASLEASTFYLNKVLSQASDDQHKAFVRQLRNALNEMKAYIKQYHTTGLEWNAKGKSLKDFKSSAVPAAPNAAVAPPPPPAPCAPAAPTPSSATASAPAASGMSAVFAQINQGSAITKGLNRVTNDMKAKNRPAEERSGLVVVPAKKANVVSSAGPAKNVAKKPPSISHNQGKWLIENFVGVDKVEIPEDVQVNHTVYIYKCENCTIVLPMKVKAICLDSCKKAGLLFGSVVSTVEIVNCHSVEVGMTGSAPSIAVDKTHGCQLILSKECLDRDPSIVTSNISEVNIRTPGENDHCDPIEMPIPEQFITKISGKPGQYKLSTQHVTHG